jgi:hypothetical protein
LRTVERQLLPVHGKKILAEELAQVFKQVSKPSYYGIVTSDCMFCLGDIDYIKDYNGNNGQPDDEYKKDGHPLQGGEEKRLQLTCQQ